MPFGRHAEPARCGEIERAGIARHFADHEGQIATAQPFLKREQQILRRLRRNVDQPVPQGARQTRTIGAPGQPDGLFVLHPQPGSPIGTVGGGIGRRAAQPVEREGQRQRCAAALAPGCEHFAMQRAVSQAGAPARRIGLRQGSLAGA